ncbi:hypothetical protein [Turicibacter sanguinis]|nr:hypothetical protein [Turicibacter sanguinis]MDB8552954.1 hypothetical protein [Turicibacter sanguinis]
MISNEQRAHDIAMFGMKFQTQLELASITAETSNKAIDFLEIYSKYYDAALKSLNEKTSID